MKDLLTYFTRTPDGIALAAMNATWIVALLESVTK